MTSTERLYWVDVSSTSDLVPLDGQGATDAITVQTGITSGMDAVVLVAYEVTSGDTMSLNRALFIKGLKTDGGVQASDSTLVTVTIRSTLDSATDAAYFNLNDMYLILKDKGSYTGTEIYQPGFSVSVTNAEAAGRLWFKNA